MAETVKAAAKSRLLIMVATACFSVLGTVLSTAWPWAYQAICWGVL